MRQKKKPREVTGRSVLIWLVAFFGVVIFVNGVMVRVATSTFGGVETESSYKAGLGFKQDIVRSRAQDDLHWKVEGKLARDAEGLALVEIAVRDSRGEAPGGLALGARLVHPTDRRLDHEFTVVKVAPGQFRGSAEAAAGQWDLTLDILRGEERVFRSKSRVGLP